MIGLVANGSHADGLLQVWWVGVGVSSLGSWSYSKECVCNLGTKLCRTVPGKKFNFNLITLFYVGTVQ